VLPRIDLAEASASVADLGVLLPIAAALSVTNGVSPVSALGIAGALFVFSGLFYRVPMPVQPIKAAAAIAIATHASPKVLAAAGLLMGVVLLGLAATRTAPLLAKLFAKPIIRGNQLGVGILLVIAAHAMIVKVPGAHGAAFAWSLAMFAVLFATERARKLPVALLVVLGGVAWSLAHGAHVTLAPHAALPMFAAPGWHALAVALPLLVVPQLPLTLGNAIVGTADVEREYYGERARRASESNLCLTCGAANIVVGLFGGMPLCHGSSGATAYYRFGARTGGVDIVVGTLLLVGGLAFGRTALGVFALIPIPVLAALLAYTGARHALLVTDLRGAPLVIAVAMGVVGAVTKNLAWGMAVGVPAYFALAGGRRLAVRRRAATAQGE
jgi:MFS superfamily sulfate permease-like transporter